MTYDNTNKGALFHNEEKTYTKHPDVKGPLNLTMSMEDIENLSNVNEDGLYSIDLYVAGWFNVSKKGQEYIAIRVEPKRQNREEKPKQSVTSFSARFSGKTAPQQTPVKSSIKSEAPNTSSLSASIKGILNKKNSTDASTTVEDTQSFTEEDIPF